jgi:hypothetical protein
MSFIDSAAEALDRAEASLNSLLMDALKAKAYRDVAAIAALAEAVAAIPGRGARKSGPAADLGLGVSTGVSTATAAPEPVKQAEPSWMRPKS